MTYFNVLYWLYLFPHFASVLCNRNCNNNYYKVNKFQQEDALAVN